MSLADGRREVVQPLDLLDAQLETVGGRVLLDARDPLGAGNRRDVVALRDEPGQRDLRRSRARLGGNGPNFLNFLNFLQDAQVAVEVLAREPRVGLTPVAVLRLELLRRTDRASEEAEAVAERRVGNEADAQLAQKC